MLTNSCSLCNLLPDTNNVRITRKAGSIFLGILHCLKKATFKGLFAIFKKLSQGLLQAFPSRHSIVQNQQWKHPINV